METTEVIWPKDAGPQPEDWENWSAEAKADFLHCWDFSTEEERTALLEDYANREGQGEWEDYLDLCAHPSNMFPPPEYEDSTLLGCGMFMVLLFLTVPAFIVWAALL